MWSAGDVRYATDVGIWDYQHRLKRPGETAEAGEDDLLITDYNHVYWAANILMANLTDSKDASGKRQSEVQENLNSHPLSGLVAKCCADARQLWPEAAPASSLMPPVFHLLLHNCLLGKGLQMKAICSCCTSVGVVSLNPAMTQPFCSCKNINCCGLCWS